MQSTKDSCLHKTLVCCCCSHTACGVGQCYDCWTAWEAYGLCSLNQQACWWTLCAPLCHEGKCGDTDKACGKCSLAARYCAFCCLLNICAPFDGCINCVLYQKDNCSEGVSSFKDVYKHKSFFGDKI